MVRSRTASFRLVGSLGTLLGFAVSVAPARADVLVQALPAETPALTRLKQPGWKAASSVYQPHNDLKTEEEDEAAETLDGTASAVGALALSLFILPFHTHRKATPPVESPQPVVKPPIPPTDGFPQPFGGPPIQPKAPEQAPEPSSLILGLGGAALVVVRFLCRLGKMRKIGSELGRFQAGFAC
jgi:hypothetical protein